SILLENDWYETNVCCLNSELAKRFDGYNLKFMSKNNAASFMLSTCESLVADNGSILLSSNQLKGNKLWQLPDNIVIFATTSQIVSNISDGMRIIKMQNKNNIPVNISAIRHFGSMQKEDFMTYGNSNKNLYLILLEDL
ncbi:MAG TPA: LUD domain-containing protein, partial [Tissierellaceae bacterium]|nr:LUD domain-containing protein [Tissierellaceae bacterium]